MRSIAVFVSVFALAATASAAPNVDRLTTIPLRLGINSIAQFAPDGREARIAVGWRDNGNAHGYRVFLVLMPTKHGGMDWNVVGFEDGQSFSDELRDEPHTGEDVVRAVRFVRTGQKPAVIVASRKWSESYYDRAETTISIYHLRRTDGGPVTRDYFSVTRQWKARKSYCNAELALRDEVHLPLAPDYDGPNTVDGCIEGSK